MENKEEQLLLKDLCARLAYRVKVKYYSMEYPYGSKPVILTPYLLWNRWENINEMRPYLRPMSSMTEEEATEFEILSDKLLTEADNTKIWNSVVDWLNEHHFDHRGLIPMGLALEAPEGMYKI